MSFWQTTSGKAPTGSAEDSFNGDFTPIPDGTIVVAMINSFELKEPDQGDPRYTIRWKIAQGEFVNRQVSQNIACFDNKPEKRDKALNMMMRLYKLCQLKPNHNASPTSNDLLPFKGKMLTIKIGLMTNKDDGKKFNFVNEVHESSYQPQESSVSNTETYYNNAANPMDDTIPF